LQFAIAHWLIDKIQPAKTVDRSISRWKSVAGLMDDYRPAVTVSVGVEFDVGELGGLFLKE